MEVKPGETKEDELVLSVIPGDYNWQYAIVCGTIVAAVSEDRECVWDSTSPFGPMVDERGMLLGGR